MNVLCWDVLYPYHLQTVAVWLICSQLLCGQGIFGSRGHKVACVGSREPWRDWGKTFLCLSKHGRQGIWFGIQKSWELASDSLSSDPCPSSLSWSCTQGCWADCTAMFASLAQLIWVIGRQKSQGLKVTTGSVWFQKTSMNFFALSKTTAHFGRKQSNSESSLQLGRTT